MHSWNEETYTKQSTFHVIAHLVVVQRHDLHQAFECANLDGGICVLCSLADDLHDVVPLALELKFLAREIKIVTKLKRDDVPLAQSCH